MTDQEQDITPAAAPADATEFAAPAPPYIASETAEQPRDEDPGSAPPEADKRHRHGRILATAVAVSLLAGAGAGAAGGYVAYRAASGASGQSTDKRQVELVSGKTDEVVAAVAAVAMPSIVDIAVSGTQSSSSGAVPPSHPDVQVQGEGSGVAFRKADGGGTYIITNNHVVEGGGALVVTDSGGESYDGKLVGADPESDIAVVLVEADIPTIKLGDSDKLVVGQMVVAIGSPFGLEQSVTSGVVSALHRALTDFGGTKEGQYPYVDAIQTDAAINPGNSGGALVDREGRLIGIPSAIFSDTGASAGVGLAIPVNRAKQAANDLIEKGAVDTPFLGILGQSVTSSLVEEMGLPVDKGAFVVEVTAGTEAEKAGVKSGDVIVAVDDKTVRSMDDLILAVRQHAVGDKVVLALWRDGKKITLDMVVGAKPQSKSK